MKQKQEEKGRDDSKTSNFIPRIFPLLPDLTDEAFYFQPAFSYMPLSCSLNNWWTTNRVSKSLQQGQSFCLFVWLIFSHLFALLPRQLNSK